MKRNFWKNKNVLVTGGTGFIGSHVVEQLIIKGAKVTVMDSQQNRNSKNLLSVKNKFEFIGADCRDAKAAEKACERKDIVMNLAARVAGIEYNMAHQGTMLRDNLLIATTMIEAARKAGVERFLVVSSACVYPRECSVPTPETEGFLGEPEPTNGGYGWAKRMAEKLGIYYAEEFGMKVGIVRPYNCYGPRDHFDPETSHVIPALIRRVLGEEDPVIVWGTGNPTRSFLYVDDLARGMIMAIEKYPVPDPVNLGTDEETSIKELIQKIVRISGLKRRMVFDRTKPDGSLRRKSDNEKAQEKIGFRAEIELEDGLRRTIEWYLQHGKK